MTTMLEPACQASFAVAALISSAAAIRAAVTHDVRVGDYLLSAGSCALAFLITVPTAPVEFSATAILLMFTGCILAPARAGARPVDLSESTLTRRNR
jgi:hypothetical protein